jgi:hypothetical protein
MVLRRDENGTGRPLEELKPVPVGKQWFAWHCLAILPTAKQQAIGSSSKTNVSSALFGYLTYSQATSNRGPKER